jgi:peptide methionine sulfoxide reductase MsrA
LLYWHKSTNTDAPHKQRAQAQEALLLVQEQLSQRPIIDWQKSQASEAPIFKENCTVVTELLPNDIFWPAEARHQQYLEKLGFRY